ncbi:MAG: FHA domain-containing protein [Myxococcota bacterium]
MAIEIRDLQSGKTLSIDTAEMTFGREGGRADIGVPNRGVSGMHARVFIDGSNWFLEDLDSSNGTYVDGKMLKRPLSLKVGLQFMLHNHGFEVISIHASEGAETAVFQGQSTAAEASPIAEEATREGPRVTASGALEDTGLEKWQPEDEDFGAEGDGDNLPADGDEPLVAFLLQTVPKALAFYLVAVPALLFNPLGYVNSGVARYRLPAFGAKGITAYAIPGLALGVVFGSLGAILTALVVGGFGVSLLVSPAISLAVSLVVAVVIGIIFHPVSEWLITALKGHSTYASRTNFFVTAQAAVPLTMFASFLTVALSLLPVPFLSVIGQLASLAATLITIYISYTWLRHFEVLKWVPQVVAVLGVLASLLTVKGIIDTVRGGVANMGSGAEIAAVDPATPPSSDQTASVVEETAGAGTVVPTDDTPKDSGERPTAKPTPAPAEAETHVEEITETTKPPSPAPAEVDEKPPAPAPEPEPEPEPEEEAEIPRSDYATFKKRRDAIELAIENDPTLLKRRGILPLYRELHRTAFSVKKSKRGKKKDGEALVQERVLQAEVYEATVATVDELYGKLF